MTWANFVSRVSWNDAVTPNLSALEWEERYQILQALENLYINSPTARMVMDAAVASIDLVIAKASILTDIAFAAPDINLVAYNLDAIEDFYYFNDHGVIVKEIPALAFIHEIMHAHDGLHLPPDIDFVAFAALGDEYLNGANVDQRGATIALTNQIALEMGWANNARASYLPAGLLSESPLLQSLQLGYSYSDGNVVDVVRIGDDGVDNIDHTLTDEPGKLVDLIFGFGGDDIIRTGLGGGRRRAEG